MSEVSGTLLARTLLREYEHHAIAKRVLDDVVLDYRADDETKAAALRLIKWLSEPAEFIARTLSKDQGE